MSQRCRQVWFEGPSVGVEVDLEDICGDHKGQTVQVKVLLSPSRPALACAGAGLCHSRSFSRPSQ